MSKKTKGYDPRDVADYEDYLSKHCREMRWEEFEESYGYLTSKTREKRMPMSQLMSYYNKGAFGSTIKEYDSVGFYAGLQEWLDEKKQ